MIKTIDMPTGKGVEISCGGVMETLEDFTAIIRSVREMLYGHLPEEVADELIAMCGKMAYATTESERIEIMSNTTDTLEKCADELEARG